MTGLLAQLAPYVVHSSGFGVLLLALALAGMACLLPLMSPGCSSLTGCRILRLDFAASGAPPPSWPGKTSRRHAAARHSRLRPGI